MELAEFVFFSLLIVLLLALAGYFGWGQVRALRNRKQNPEERRFSVGQAWRRLFCCALMVLFAGLLVGGFFLDQRFRELHGLYDQEKTLPEAERNQATTEDYKNFARSMGVYWGVALLVVFVLLSVAAMDLWAIARFGIRQHRQLQADHRSDLEEEIARLRQQRNGLG